MFRLVLPPSDRGRRQTSSPSLSLSFLACGCHRVLGSLGLLSSGTSGRGLLCSPATPRHFLWTPSASALSGSLPTCARSQRSRVSHPGRGRPCPWQLLLTQSLHLVAGWAGLML